MQIIYKSDDGLLFDTEFDCIVHEFNCLLKTVNIRVYDKKGHRLDNIASEDIYNKVHRVVICNEEELAVLERIRTFMGIYLDINSVGTWIWNDDKGVFIKKE